jgi:hypothetical protein
MSQQDAAKQQANTRNNIRVVSIFTAAAIGIVGVLVILYAWQLPPFTRQASLPITPTCAGKPPLSARRSTAISPSQGPGF